MKYRCPTECVSLRVQDVEIVRLWAPNQTVIVSHMLRFQSVFFTALINLTRLEQIRAVSKVSDWKNDLAAHNKRAEQHTETALSKMAALVGKRKKSEATLSSLDLCKTSVRRCRRGN